MTPRDRLRTAIRYGLSAAALLFMATVGGGPSLAATPACLEQTASPLASGGIGGTGAVAEGGIGGTGIVGTVTGFASVCVNGLEVHYDSATPISRNGSPADVAALALGQVIAIDAARSESGLTARRISILDVLEGPVTEAASKSGLIRVMGQAVRVDAATRLGGLPALAEARLGMVLRVSGFRDVGGEVYATRIETAPGLADSSAIGVLARSAAGDTSLDGLPVLVAAPLPAAPGEVLLRGHWDGRRLVAREAHVDPSLPFAGHADRIVAEGLILARGGQNRLRIAGFEVELTSETQIAGDQGGPLLEGMRVRVSGRLEGRNRIVAQQIEHDGPPHRHGPGSAPVQGKHGSALPGDPAAAMERRGSPERPQRLERLEHIPLSRPGTPAGTGMPRPGRP